MRETEAGLVCGVCSHLQSLPIRGDLGDLVVDLHDEVCVASREKTILGDTQIGFRQKVPEGNALDHITHRPCSHLALAYMLGDP